MTSKNSHWCAAPNCMLAINVEKRHYFRFPKEHDRWLAWVQACGRTDLLPKGPEYAYQNCRLCHLHFDEKLYSIKKRTRLHPNAIPIIFYMCSLNNSNEIANSTMAVSEEEDNNINMAIENQEQEGINRNPNEENAKQILSAPVQEDNDKGDLQSLEMKPMHTNMQTVEPSTSSGIRHLPKNRNNKLLMENRKLKAKIKICSNQLEDYRKEKKKVKEELQQLRKKATISKNLGN